MSKGCCATQMSYWWKLYQRTEDPMYMRILQVLEVSLHHWGTEEGQELEHVAILGNN